MTLRMFRVLAGVLSACMLAGSAWAVNTASLTATTSGSTVSFSGSASTTGLANGTYNATLTVTPSGGGSTVISGSASFTVGSTSGMTLTTVDGATYYSGMSVTSTAPQICGTYSNPSDVVVGYIAVMGGSAISRYQIIAPGTGGSFCANLVLDPGSNSVLAAYVSLSGALVVSNGLTITNGSTNVAAGSLRVQLTWDKVNDMDLHMYSPSSAGGTATTSSYGEHIYYSSKTHTWGQLDIDKLYSNGGYGPENITVNSFPVKPGKYLITVYAYSMSGYTSTNNTVTIYTGAGQTLLSRNFSLTATGQTYMVGYVNVAADGSYTIEALGSLAGDDNSQIIEPPAGYVPPPKE